MRNSWHDIFDLPSSTTINIQNFSIIQRSNLPSDMALSNISHCIAQLAGGFLLCALTVYSTDNNARQKLQLQGKKAPSFTQVVLVLSMTFTVYLAIMVVMMEAFRAILRFIYSANTNNAIAAYRFMYSLDYILFLILIVGPGLLCYVLFSRMA